MTRFAVNGRPAGHGRFRAVTLTVLVALVLGACTDDGEPPPAPPSTTSPTPSDASPSPAPEQLTVAIVLPAAGEATRELAVYERAVDRVRAAFREDVADVRQVHLDGAAFRRDVLALLGDQAIALTCAFGAGARDVLAVAAQLPGQRFCAVDDRVDDVPANVVAAWIRYEEAAYVLGFAAANMLGEGPGGTLGVVAPALDGRTERERQAFTAGARAARPDVIVEVATLTDEDVGSLEERAAAAAAQLYDEAEAAVVLLTVGVPPEPVLRAAEERLRLVAGIGPPLSEGVPAGLEPFVLATAHARLERALAVPISRVLEGWQAGTTGLGFADEALVLTPGGSVRWNEVRAEVADLRARIESGEVDPTG